MDFLIKLGAIILIAIPIYFVIRILLIAFHKKLSWMENLHKKLTNTKKEKVISFTVLLLSGFLCYYFSEFLSFNNIQLGLALGLFLGITNIFDPKMLK
jgi:ABC-type dipeptide/oligopeptide/nickel transport system permease component